MFSVNVFRLGNEMKSLVTYAIKKQDGILKLWNKRCLDKNIISPVATELLFFFWGGGGGGGKGHSNDHK